MCGIAGYLGKKRFESQNIKEILSTMLRRGPDSTGFKEIIFEKNYLSIFFSRLNIIDNHNRSNQPFIYKDKYLIFNGAIYNYLELRSELENKGYHFKTTSDTEVLIKVLDCWGELGIKKLEGMWSFFFYDKLKKRAILSRDRFGEKPLFYYHENNEFIFSSEIKTINKILNNKLSVNLNKVEDLLRYGYRKLYKDNSSYFKNIFNFPRGYYFIIENNNKIIKRKYWEIKYEPNEESENTNIKIIKDALFKSLELRLRADFPIAFFLSGGIDSNSLAFIAKKYFKYNLNTFSIISNDKKYDESEYINYSLKTLGAKHKNLKIDFNKIDFFEILLKQVKYHYSPISSISSLLQFALLKIIKNEGYRVAISGLGADEIFSGYYDHHLLYLNEIKDDKELFKTSFKHWKRYVLPITRNPLLKNYVNFAKIQNIKKHTYQIENFKKEIFLKKKIINFKENDYVDSLMKNRMINQLTNETVPNGLNEIDMNSMYYSIESRNPYLDSQLFQKCLNMPSKYYIKNGMAKWPLRKIIEGIVPDKIRLNKKKIGFNASFENIFDLKNNKNIEFLLNDSQLFDMIDKKKFLQLLNKKKNFSSVENIFLFNFLSSKVFLQNFS